MSRIEVSPDSHSLAQAAAGYIGRIAAEAISSQGRFTIGLPGGSTPRTLFNLLGSPAWAGRIDWARAHIFWGDERCVPPDHPESNYRLARETLLDRVPVPAEQIHRIPGELPPAEAARAYERTLRTFFGEGDSEPRFDLLLQGLGDDGHTASLFPGTAALEERTRWVVENYVPRLDSWRITLTAPAINAASHVIFLVSGAGKAEALRAVLQGPLRPSAYPAQLIRPCAGQLLWLVDQAAAALL
ncbi:MAG: 6-phosphogluconolactonase [Anaerolineae bacterium]